MQDECSKNIGLEFLDSMTSPSSADVPQTAIQNQSREPSGVRDANKTSEIANASEQTSCLTIADCQTASSAEIHASRTARLSVGVSADTRVLAVSSSGLLMNFARELFCERIQASSEKALPGLGGECDLNWNRLVTLCCPSDCEPVALGLSIKGNECSCSPSLPTPTASDWKGGKRKRKAGSQVNLRDEFTQRTGWLYLHPEDMEVAAGFPATWSELPDAETPFIRLSPNGLDAE